MSDREDVTVGEGRYVEGAVVAGISAHVLDRVLRSPNVRRSLDRLPAWVRAEVEATRRAIGRAAAAYESLPPAVDGSAETEVAEAAPDFEREIDTATAADLLGVSERRVRQLAAEGMGRRVAGRWLLDRGLVMAYGERRRAA